MVLEVMVGDMVLEFMVLGGDGLRVDGSRGYGSS